MRIKPLITLNLITYSGVEKPLSASDIKFVRTKNKNLEKFIN